MSNVECMLTKNPSKLESNIMNGFSEYYSESCGGYYYMTMGAIEYLNAHTPFPNIAQGHLNCASKTLSLNSENAIPVWITETFSLEAISILQTSRDPGKGRQLVPCRIEEYFTEPVDHGAKPLRLLSSLGRKLEILQPFSLTKVSQKDRVYSRIINDEEAAVILNSLISERLLDCTDYGRDLLTYGGELVHLKYRITPKGWSELRKGMMFPTGNKVFIAAQFELPNKEDDEIHRSAVEAMKRACSKLGYAADFVNQAHTDNISDRIIADIKNSRFVVADFTYNNRGVYYEAGFARGIGIPVFHVVREGHATGDDSKGKKVHFDIAQVMYRTWSDPVDLETKLSDWIRARIGPFGDMR